MHIELRREKLDRSFQSKDDSLLHFEIRESTLDVENKHTEKISAVVKPDEKIELRSYTIPHVKFFSR
jgi:hypothetical protein